MALKKIEAVIAPPSAHMVGDGFRVHSFFPGGKLIDKKRMSPFFLLDYNAKVEFNPTDTPRGVGVHPHAGFETVTIAYQGKVAHHDSAGNSGIINEGEVQWMTAGAGLLHKEYHEKEFSKKGGVFQMVQLWVNLPAANKKVAPSYQAITRKKVGIHKLLQDNGTIEVIAGDYEGTKGAATTHSPIEVYNAKLDAGGKANFNFPANYNTGFLMVDGSANINGENVQQDHFVLFGNEGTEITVETQGGAIILVLSGEPIDEPIAAYGPFLMNTWPEVEQAIEDANRGKYGVLED